MQNNNRTTTLMKLVCAYKHYIEILGDEINEIAGLCLVHGWRTTRYKDGEKARKTIRELENKIKW